MMIPILGNVAALSVAIIFYAWRMLTDVQKRQRRVRAERVSYMLWCMAEQVDVPNDATRVEAF